jgi:hypothetical protein
VPDFFQPGHAYLHHLPDGSPSDEGLFLVAYVGRAPEPFEHHSETEGVAFGWRQRPGPNGVWEGAGSYDTPDFAGWREVTLPDTAAVPNGCRWCGVPLPHGLQHLPGIGLHAWEEPSGRQRLERMRARRSAASATGIDTPQQADPHAPVEVVTARWDGEVFIDEDGAIGVPLTVEGTPVVLTLSDGRAVDLAAELTDCHKANTADGNPMLTQED